MDQKVVTKIGKYEIVAELGQGGMGVVYKARDPFIGRLVALKTITPELISDPEILKRFYREAQSAGTLQHPNIVTIYDLGEAEGRPYIAMEFVEGESLQSIINRRARIPLAAKLKLVHQFCEGLGHAHKHGFVHRDVKPANILVTINGTVKVVDFGIVHLESADLTKAGTFLGTIHYASPEQINGEHVDNRSDVWSVICVVYELIAYKKAFEGSNVADVVAEVLSAEPESLSRCCPGVPADLDTVISKGLKKNIEERYQSMDEMLGDLLPIARGLQLSFIGNLLLEAKDLRSKGDFTGAQEKVRAVLILDNTHGDAKRLQNEITAELQRLAPATKAKRLVAEAEKVFSHGEYAEAVRILSQAQQLNPADTQARNLMEKAQHAQDRACELREALTSGQKALKQGDLTGAEQDLHRVLQIDQKNSQAAELLEQIRQDRLAREQDFRRKEALWQADSLVAEGKYEEAQSRLQQLQQDSPGSDEIRVKLQILNPLIRSRKFFQEGEHAFQQGEYAEAGRALSEALRLDPQNKEARELKARALQERDRLRQISEALISGQWALREKDAGAAEREFQRALQLDPTNTQATISLAQIRQSQAAWEAEGPLREALQQFSNLVAEGKLDDARQVLLDLQQRVPNSAEIDQKLLDLDQKMKLARLLSEAQQVFEQGEFGEAVRILTEAQEVDPIDPRVLDLKVRAVQERDRLRQVREAISAGQRAMRLGHPEVAEHEYQRALQLDPTSTQATNLLAQIQKDREKREQGRKDESSPAENLPSQKKSDEAQGKPVELPPAPPKAEEVQQKPPAATPPVAEAPAPAPPSPPLPAPNVAAEKSPSPVAPLDEISRSMQLADELRRRLQTPRPPEPGPPTTPSAPAPAKRSSPTVTTATPSAPAPAKRSSPTVTTATPKTPTSASAILALVAPEAAKTEPVAKVVKPDAVAKAPSATMMLSSTGKMQAAEEPKAPEKPAAPPPPPVPEPEKQP